MVGVLPKPIPAPTPIEAADAVIDAVTAAAKAAKVEGMNDAIDPTDFTTSTLIIPEGEVKGTCQTDCMYKCMNNIDDNNNDKTKKVYKKIKKDTSMCEMECKTKDEGTTCNPIATTETIIKTDTIKETTTKETTTVVEEKIVPASSSLKRPKKREPVILPSQNIPGLYSRWQDGF